jgi:hypothetical protein
MGEYMGSNPEARSSVDRERRKLIQGATARSCGTGLSEPVEGPSSRRRTRDQSGFDRPSHWFTRKFR